MGQLTARTKKGMATIVTSEQIHLMDLEHVPESVKEFGHKKAYDMGEPIKKKLSARKESK